MTAFTFDPESHTYRLGDRVLPSVTQILQPIKPDFSMVQADVLERKRQLGQAVHAACELDDFNALDEAETDPLVLAYLAGWRKFRADTGALVICNEQQLHHASLMYAGTLDRLLMVGRERWLVDIKTVYPQPVPSFGVQLAGYDELLRWNSGGEQCSEVRASVHLLDDGTYRMKQYKNPNDYAVFRALLSVAHWKLENMK